MENRCAPVETLKLSTLQQTLAELDLRPAKSLGQNFLHDQNLARWIVDELDPAPDESVVEIGPGLGALSELLATRCRRLILLEKDRRLAAFLTRRFGSDLNVQVLHTDALAWDVRLLFPMQPVKIIGNLPYYVSSQLLLKFTGDPAPAGRCVFTLQKELADRLSAVPRTKDYGALTLMIQRRWRVRPVRTLPPSVFLPAPQVDSAVVVLDPRSPDEVPFCDSASFTRLVKQGFSQRRKQLRKMLGIARDDWPVIARAIGFGDESRAEDLTLEQWIALTNHLVPLHADRAQNGVLEIFDIVDDEDRIIGSAPRREVHAGSSRHRAVHIFVFNQAGELFLQKRSRWKDMHPLRWDSSAAGHVETGCTYEETAPRELHEELGIDAPVDFLCKIPPSQATGWEWVHLFTARHDGPFVLPPCEIETGEFFPVPLIDEWLGARPNDFATGFIECFKAWRAASTTSGMGIDAPTPPHKLSPTAGEPLG
jgi:16S rRNA (adenine1518-N6/adenine1519-N6)-dimethyltransferase